MTVEEAKARLLASGSWVVAATLHEETGDRRVWFVGLAGWNYLTSDGALIELASEGAAPLVQEAGARQGIHWPEGGSQH